MTPGGRHFGKVMCNLGARQFFRSLGLPIVYNAANPGWLSLPEQITTLLDDIPAVAAT